MSGNSAKVIGVSRVTITTLLHPKAPYFVLVLEDEYGNKWVQKSIKEYKIDEEWTPLDGKYVTGQSKNAVAIWRVKYDILEAIGKTMELLGDINVSQNSKILILPTLISPKHPYFAENTTPQFLENIIKYLVDKGAKTENIKVSGQSFDEIPVEASAQKSQLLQVCQNFKILPLDLAKTNFIKKSEGQFNFEISEEVFSSDLIINLPILKVGKLAASENVLKFLKKENYLSLKYLYSDEEILETLSKVLPDFLTVADGGTIQKTNKLTAFLGIILASHNSLNLDRVFAEISMIKPLPGALEKVKIDDIPLIGRNIIEVQYEIEKF